MYGKKKITRNVTKLMAILLAVVCVIQTVEPVNVKADTDSDTVPKVDYSDEVKEGRDYTMDENGCVTLLASGIDMLENGSSNGRCYTWDYNAMYNMTSITLPDEMTRINDYAFYSCYALESITIPDSVTYIGGYKTFMDCESLKSITIPENVEDMVIDDTTFNSCESLKKVTISGKGTTIGRDSFSVCSYDCDNVLTSIVINDADVILESRAFNAAYVKKIVLPEGLTEIPDEAFINCNVLTSINIPSTVTKIGDQAFCYNHKLTSITIPKNVTSIGDLAFAYCDKLTSVNIPKNVTSIGEGAFFDCEKLTSVTFEKNTSTSQKLTIGYRAFAYRKKLTSVTIPRNVKSLAAGVFKNCTSLKKITIKGNVDTIKANSICGGYGLETVIITGNVGKIGSCGLNEILKKVEIRGTLGSGQKNIVATKVMINGKTVKKYRKEYAYTMNDYVYYNWYLIK